MQTLSRFDTDSDKFEAETHAKYIVGGNVGQYMESLKEDDEEVYAKQFSQYIKHGVDAENIEAMYEKAHDAIRANPCCEKKVNAKASEKKFWGSKRLSLSERKNKIAQKKKSFMHAMAQEE